MSGQRTLVLSLDRLDLSRGSTTMSTVARLLDGEALTVVPTGGELPSPDHAALSSLSQSQAHSDDAEGYAVVATSGSSAMPKRVVLRPQALRASAEATAGRLGGPGAWVLCLPPWHIAGFQVLVRSMLAGTPPSSTLGGQFTGRRFAAALAQLPDDGPRYAALVPAQLTRLMEDRTGQAALRDLDSVLIGGGALAGSLGARAHDLGAPVVTTYGMTETAGGCIYDGQALDGVTVRVDPSGHLMISGPMLADGYLQSPTGDPGSKPTSPFSSDPDGTRWFRTDDLGTAEPDPDTGATLVRVLGRADDVIITGGHKVNPTDVDHALLRLPEVRSAATHGVPHPEWGSVVASAVVARGWPSGLASSGLHRQVRERLRSLLPAHALPRVIVVIPAMPMLESGKPDRRSLVSLLQQAMAE